MARHRRRLKKKKLRRSRSVSQSETRFSRDKTCREFGKLTKNSQTYNHPYATRSKTLDNSVSSTTCDRRKKAMRKLSENSVIFLGAYRKVPQLIDLEDTTSTTSTATMKSPTDTSRYSYRELCGKINIESWFKVERMDCQDVT